MSIINREVIQEIKEKIDMLSLVEKYVPLQRVGSRFRGPCPFHQETKPSFYIDPNLGLYHCFGCHASGDIIDFYCKINGVDFYQGILELAEEVGVDINKSLKKTGQRSSKRRTLLEINSIALDFFYESLKKYEPAKKYLKERQIPKQLIESFQIGYAADSWDGLKNFLIKKGYSLLDAVEAGLLIKNEKNHIYDRFRSRIIFPIHDISGRCIGFGGRIIVDGEPKYLNTSENQIFKKGENLYGLYQARKEIRVKKCAILTEGYIDVIRLHQHGYQNSCGVLGTALTEAHVKKISNLCSKVILIFDGDEAGIKATIKSAQLFLAHGTKVEVVELPLGEDIDSFLLKQGNIGLDKLIKRAEEGLAFCAKMIRLNNSPREIIAWCREFISSLVDPALIGFYLPVLSREFGIPEIELRRSLDLTEKRTHQKTIKPYIVLGDREILKFAICFPEYIKEMEKLGVAEYLKNDSAKILWNKLTKYSCEEILYQLEDSERSFYIESLFFKEKEEDTEKLWKEIKDFLEKKQRERLIKQVKQCLVEAQIKKDQDKIKFYLTQINNLCKK